MRGSIHLLELNQIPAGVVQDGGCHRSKLHRRLCKRHAESLKAAKLDLDIVNTKQRAGDAISDKGLFEWTRGRMLVWLKQQLNAIQTVWRYKCQPAKFAHWNIMLLYKTKFLCVELQRFLLIIHKDARDDNLHFSFSPFCFCSAFD